jgi:hypothetical protein
MQNGNTFGRYLDGADNWKLLFYPTPGAPNSDSIPLPNYTAGLDFENGLSLYPNPANELVHVMKAGTAVKGKCTLEVYDLQGRLTTATAMEVFAGKRWTVSTESLPAGSYILVLKHSEGISNARFTKAN